MLNGTRLFKLQSNCRNTQRHIYHCGKATSRLSGFGCCLTQPQERLTAEAHPSGRELMSCPSPRQLEMELGCPSTLLPLGIPDLWAAQPGYWRLVQGFNLSHTTARSSQLEGSPTVNWQVIKQHFCSKTAEQLDGLG